MKHEKNEQFLPVSIEKNFSLLIVRVSRHRWITKDNGTKTTLPCTIKQRKKKYIFCSRCAPYQLTFSFSFFFSYDFNGFSCALVFMSIPRAHRIVKSQIGEWEEKIKIKKKKCIEIVLQNQKQNIKIKSIRSVYFMLWHFCYETCIVNLQGLK